MSIFFFEKKKLNNKRQSFFINSKEINNNGNLGMELLQSDRNLLDNLSIEEEEEEEEESKKQNWENSLIGLEKKEQEIKEKYLYFIFLFIKSIREDKISNFFIQENDKEWMLNELKNFKKLKADEHNFLSFIYEWKEKLEGSEIKNLFKTMKNIHTLEEVIPYSNYMIDSVIKDINKKKHQIDNEIIILIIDLLKENGRLRKIINDYHTQNISQETLEKYKNLSSIDNKIEEKSETLTNTWNTKFIFDFFSGWIST